MTRRPRRRGKGDGRKDRIPKKAFDVLRARGYVEWCNAEDRLREVMDEGMVTAYVGFDPTADSLHDFVFSPMFFLSFFNFF